MFKKKVFLCIVLFELLSACGVQLESGDQINDPAPKTATFENKIQGPVVDGQWQSLCQMDTALNRYKIQFIEFSKGNFIRNETLFSDIDCRSEVKKSTYKGQYRWSEVTSYGGFLVDYKIDLGGGWTSETSEEVLVENSKLYLSNFMIGFGTISKKFPLIKLNIQGEETL